MRPFVVPPVPPIVESALRAVVIAIVSSFVVEMATGCGASDLPRELPGDAAAGSSLDAARADGSPTDGSADAASDSTSDAAVDAGMIDARVADASSLDAGPMPSFDDDWALRETRVAQAWERLARAGRGRGLGVVIAHADTGISRHPELLAHADLASPIAWELGWDFVDGDADPDHDFTALNRIPPTHGHGTETASVIVSPPGCPVGAEPPCVTGVAPEARLVPLRVSDSVVLLSGDLVAEGVERATTLDADVISISMGGVGEMPRLQAAIERALEQGIIVVAAAGNFTGRLVVQPSTFDGVVCVAGVTPELEPWGRSARGSRVDISGPSVDVRHARTVETRGEREYRVGLASGTSDATAMVAGAAALWLSLHGKEALVARYGPAGVPRVFRELLRTRGYRELPDWPTDRFGPGMLDVDALLAAPLP
ncbi:MAG: S8 family serine peptidase [Myxococcota bacterium]|jgi:thermitase|nr:S8 family serine peptidase [Myxococcota bacterium]